MRRAYTFLLYLLTPAALLYLAWRGLRAPAYWRRWPERFGVIPALPIAACDKVLWLHAISVGEVQATLPIVRALLARFPHYKILLTTQTPTGSERVRINLPTEVAHCYIPYDLPFAVERFLNRVRPRLMMTMESGLWPNIFHLCRQRGIPVIIANGRLSERSARRYGLIKSLMIETLSNVSAVAAQTELDKLRLIDFGINAECIRVTGNIKFEVSLPASLHEQAAVLRRAWGVERAVWIAASTHEGEEQQILDAFASVKKVLPHCLLVLTPRHPERFAKVAVLCQKRGYKVIRRSENSSCDTDTDIFLGDTMGELPLFYAASDVAFVGGSLTSNGGHNVLEPAALGLAVIAGPFMFNFEEIFRLLREAGAAKQISDAYTLSKEIIAYLQDANLRDSAGAKGQQIVAQNRGALNGLMEIIEKYIE